MKFIGFCALLTFAALTLSAAPAQEQPEATTATYRDWMLRCGQLPTEPPRQVCEVAQTIRTPDGANVLGQLVLGRPAPDQKFKLIVQLPPGVWLPANVQLLIDGATAATASYKSCGQLCFADTDLDDATLAVLRARTEPVQLAFEDGGRRRIELPVSVMGLAAALDAANPTP